MSEARRWVRADGKTPLRLDGRHASSTNPRSWASYGETAASKMGYGLGVMMGDGLAVYDFDHCFDASGILDDDAAETIRGIRDMVLYIEVSCSGEGLHVFVRSSARSYRRGGVEFYSRARFVRMTCCPFRGWEAVCGSAKKSRP